MKKSLTKKEQEKLIKECFKEGISFSGIALICGVCPSSVTHWKSKLTFPISQAEKVRAYIEEKKGNSVEKLKSLIEQLTSKIDQLEDYKLHENEMSFDRSCEKYVDDCAIAILQGLLSNSYLQKEFLKDLDKLEKSMGVEFEQGKRAEHNQWNHAMVSYSFAEAMLKEKLRRNEKLS